MHSGHWRSVASLNSSYRIFNFAPLRFSRLLLTFKRTTQHTCHNNKLFNKNKTITTRKKTITNECMRDKNSSFHYILDASLLLRGIILQFRSLSLLYSESMKFNVFLVVICFFFSFLLSEPNLTISASCWWGRKENEWIAKELSKRFSGDELRRNLWSKLGSIRQVFEWSNLT